MNANNIINSDRKIAKVISVEDLRRTQGIDYQNIDTDRDAVIKRIRKALKDRSGKTWSVKGGSGTSWGWIEISAPPARCTWSSRLKQGTKSQPGCEEPSDYEPYDTGERGRSMGPEDQHELAKLLGVEYSYALGGVSVPASSEHYREYVDRAEGRPPRKIAKDYWD